MAEIAARCTRGHLRGLCALLLLMAWFASAMPAFAHAKIVRTLPADGSVNPLPPHEIQLWFTEPIVPEFSSVTLIDAVGHQITLNHLHIDVADRRILFASLPTPDSLPAGVYNLTWNVLSPDGHYTRGYSVFGVGDAVLSSTSTAELQTETLPPLIEIGLRGMTYSLLALLTGSLVSLTWIFRSADIARRRAYYCALICAMLLLPMGVLWLVWQGSLLTGSLSDQASIIEAMGRLVSETQWGTIWLIREAIVLALFILLLRNRMPRAGGQWIAFAFVLALCVAQAGAGHSASVTPVSSVAIATAALHVFAAGVWLGGLATMFIALPPRLLPNGRVADVLWDERWLKFSSQALIGASLLGVTGIYNTARQVQSIDALIGTIYGQVLIVKVLLVFGAAGIGLVNTTRLHPTSMLARLLHQSVGRASITSNPLGRMIVLELCMGAFIILATSFLTAVAPAHGPEFMAPMSSTSPNQIADDMLIALSVKPNRPGQNLFVVEAGSMRRPEPAPIARVILRIRNNDTDLGLVTVDASRIDKNRFQVGGDYLSLAGYWQIEVVIRRRGLDDATATFNWIMTGSVTRPTLISNVAWEPSLIYFSFSLGIVWLVLTLVVIGHRFWGRLR